LQAQTEVHRVCVNSRVCTCVCLLASNEFRFHFDLNAEIYPRILESYRSSEAIVDWRLHGDYNAESAQCQPHQLTSTLSPSDYDSSEF